MTGTVGKMWGKESLSMLSQRPFVLCLLDPARAAAQLQRAPGMLELDLVAEHA